jgi:hypothetical protein
MYPQEQMDLSSQGRQFAEAVRVGWNNRVSFLSGFSNANYQQFFHFSLESNDSSKASSALCHHLATRNNSTFFANKSSTSCL